MKDKSFFHIGLVFLSVAIFLFYINQEFEIGTATDMGPGYFPLLLSAVMCVFGMMCVVISLRERGDLDTKFSARNMVLIMISILIFATMLPYAGFLLTAFLSLVVSSMTNHDFRWRPVMIYSAAMTVIASLIFPVGLGLQMPLWPVILR